ncbi:MAG TPA: hypothetical protein VGI54_08220 [Solirubrobacteraceae bacterium]|jgi:hypothetical protein
MAQTKRKRRSKHRGTAGGTVVARGRTGRKPTSGEVRDQRKSDAKAKRSQRYTKPPTWRGAFQRAGIVTLIFIALVLVALRGKVAPTLILVPFVLIMYTVMGYYTDLWLHRRWLKRQAGGGGR